MRPFWYSYVKPVDWPSRSRIPPAGAPKSRTYGSACTMAGLPASSCRFSSGSQVARVVCELRLRACVNEKTPRLLFEGLPKWIYRRLPDWATHYSRLLNWGSCAEAALFDEWHHR